MYEVGNLTDVDFDSLPLMNKWILSRLSGMVDNVNDAMRIYDFHVASKGLKDFLYYDFCDVFLVSPELQDVAINEANTMQQGIGFNFESAQCCPLTAYFCICAFTIMNSP